MRFFDFSSDWFNIVFSWKNNFHIWKISFGVKISFSDFFLLLYLGNLSRDLAPRACWFKLSLWSWKNHGFAILRKIRKWPFLAKIDPNLVISSLIRRIINIFFIKKFWIFFIKKSFWAKKSTFHPYDSPYVSPVLHLDKFWNS